MAKVFFIYFDLHTGYYPSFHHRLAYLIGQLKKEGNEVLLAHLTDEKDFSPTKNRIQSDRPDVIGLSFTTNQRKYVHRFLNKTKFIAKLIIAGGVHCSLKKEEVFNSSRQAGRSDE